jgi:hypothetical protein
VPRFAREEERKAWEAIAARFESPVGVKPSRDGVVLGVTRLREDEKRRGVCSLTLDGASGRVVQVSSDGPVFSNAALAELAVFTELRSLTCWHNGHVPASSPGGDQAFDGTGLRSLRELPRLESLTLSGGTLTDAGMVEVAQLPRLRVFNAWHTRITDAGLSRLAEHAALEEIALGPFWEAKATDRALAHLASCPRLARIKLMESWYTWEGGLRQLLTRKDTLRVVDLDNCLIEPGDVERLRLALPGVKVQWQGLAGAGRVLRDSGWQLGKAKKWMPAELIERAMKEAEGKGAGGERPRPGGPGL